MDRLIQMGKDLGYEGGKLQDFVKQQQDYERGERIAEGNLKGIESRRKKAKAEKDREIELAKIAAQEKDREIELAKFVAQEKDREIELARIATEER